MTGDDKSGFDAAVAAAQDAQVAILVLGDKSGLGTEGTTGEGRDRVSLQLPGVQQELLEAVVATGTPVVLVLINGRPLAQVGRPNTFRQSWKPGCQEKKVGQP